MSLRVWTIRKLPNRKDSRNPTKGFSLGRDKLEIEQSFSTETLETFELPRLLSGKRRASKSNQKTLLEPERI